MSFFRYFYFIVHFSCDIGYATDEIEIPKDTTVIVSRKLSGGETMDEEPKRSPPQVASEAPKTVQGRLKQEANDGNPHYHHSSEKRSEVH